MSSQPVCGTIFRYEVPVDDQWHHVLTNGAVLHVAARQPDVVDFWARSFEGNDHINPNPGQWLRVFATGQPLPDAELDHCGTTVTAGGSLVWHLVKWSMRNGCGPTR